MSPGFARNEVFATIGMKTNITTQPPLLSKACVETIPMPPFTGSPKCSPVEKTLGSLLADSLFLHPRMSAWPTPGPSLWPMQPSGHAKQLACPSANSTSHMPRFFSQPVPKSNSATLAISKAKQAIQDSPVQSVPSSIQDRHGRNKNHRNTEDESYLYSHDFPENISGQQYLEKPLDLYHPKNSGAESAIAERINQWKIIRNEMNT